MMDVNIEPPEGWEVVGHAVVSEDESWLRWDDFTAEWEVKCGTPDVVPFKPRWIVRRKLFPDVDCFWVPGDDKSVVAALEYMTRCVMTHDSNPRIFLKQLTEALRHLQGGEE